MQQLHTDCKLQILIADAKWTCSSSNVYADNEFVAACWYTQISGWDYVFDLVKLGDYQR